MFRNDDALRAISVHSLEVPNLIIVINLRAKYMTPAACYSLRYEVMVDLPILPDRFNIFSVTRIPVPCWIHCEMYSINGSVIGLVVVNDVMKLVGRNKQRSVVS